MMKLNASNTPAQQKQETGKAINELNKLAHFHWPWPNIQNVVAEEEVPLNAAL